MSSAHAAPDLVSRALSWGVRTLVVVALGALVASGGYALRAAFSVAGRVGALEVKHQSEERERENLRAWLERIEQKLDRLTERVSAR